MWENEVHSYCFHRNGEVGVNQMLLIKWSSASVTTCLKAEFLPVCWSGAFRSFTQCQQRNTSTVMKLNWRGLVLMDSTASGKNQTQHIRTKRRSRGDGLDWFGIGLDILQSLSRPWTTLYTRVRCEATCLSAEDRAKPGPATGQWSQAQQQNYNRMDGKEKTWTSCVTKWTEATFPHLMWEIVRDW